MAQPDEFVGGVCSKCVSYPTKFTAANNMDPNEVPDELKRSTFLEQQLIALVHPIVSVYRVKGQQFAYSEHVISFPQDVTASRAVFSSRSSATVVSVASAQRGSRKIRRFQCEQR